jgi:hypothetical protein
VAGRVDQVQDVGVAVLRRVVDADGVGLDGDAALALDIHGVEQLLLHVALGHRAGQLDQPVGEGGFPVVDMGDDGEVADAGEVGHANNQSESERPSALTAALGPPRHRRAAPRHGDLVRLGAPPDRRDDLATRNRAERPSGRRAAARRWRGSVPGSNT